MTSERRISLAVLQAVAEAEGVDPEELRPFLYDAVDVDALDFLFRGTTGAITFEYAGYEVTVDDEANVELSPKGGERFAEPS